MTHIYRCQERSGKEAIHSGHFMVSHFEAEAQDEFDDLAVPVPDEESHSQKVSVVTVFTSPGTTALARTEHQESQHQQLSIETSLTKLFKCMTLAYRQKLTSPKWNRFKGIKLRWKDKIRLNNVIWRCWHMQFIKKQNTLVCQFASPLDVDTHVKPETTILEGKYWKRRAEAVIAEYKKWRMFHIMRLFGKGDASVVDTISEMDTVESFSQCGDLAGTMLMDEDYLNFMSDTLFSTISSHQPFAFPDPREIARGASIADFIQPSLGPLQPNLDDFMDTLEPLQDMLLTPRLPSVPEESALQDEPSLYRNNLDPYSTQNYMHSQANQAIAMPATHITLHGPSTNQQILSNQSSEQMKNDHSVRLYDNSRMFHSEIPTNVICNETNYAHQGPSEQIQNNLYSEKTRLHYGSVEQPKIVNQQNTAPVYSKYNNILPPSQTAPETVSLLQQPVQNPKYASTVVIQNRNAKYDRNKSNRPRIAHYQNQVQNSPYQNYGQSQNVSFERAKVQSQSQYIQPVETYKGKALQSPSSSRTFKMPSPPPMMTPATQPVPVSNRGAIISPKENFRSSSLPIGAQLNSDWTITNYPESSTTASKHTPRALTLGEGSCRNRSRSSEASAPDATVALAQLLNARTAQHVFKMGSNSEESNDPTKSPGKRRQPSPSSDAMSPYQMSPGCSPPQSPSGSPRRSHMHAEQKRRYNIKNGFDTLQVLIPHLNNNPAAKVSKAAMLQKGAEYIKQLKTERNQIKEEMDNLRQQIECLNNSISNCHSLLPATGAPVSRARAGRLREMFARHVHNRTMHNWKYWLFSVVAATLIDSFSSCVSCNSGADLVRTTLLWAEQHCSLVEMRPAVLNSLRVLCTTTDILTNPERLPDEARAAIASTSGVKTEPT